MAIDERFFRYLDHLGATLPVRALAQDLRRDGVALRHDVDHDLHLALELAYWEHERGVQATYFLLHDAPYWQDEKLEDACRQLAAFGHEVGLHLNPLTEWASGRVDDPSTSLSSALARLRATGVDVVGSASHGDRLCYELGFINYWCFRELRGDAPAQAERGLSAEGVPDPTGGFTLDYPSDHLLRRSDGRTFPLWSLSMAAVGLLYEAVKVPVDGYFTDSGGSWQRSVDPLEVDLSRGRHQVLLHPEYWRGPQRLYLFLSTARSGSAWLASVLDEASSVTARHELTLNHERSGDGELVPLKRTGAGFTELLRDSTLTRRLMATARAWMESLETDYAEANVYLAHLLPLVAEVFPDAVLVHLHRDPRLVVESLLDRGWYDADEDDRHPAAAVPGWDDMDQLERACWYVRTTCEALLALTPHRVPLMEAAADPASLADLLRPLGVAVFPELDHAHRVPVNAARAREVGAYDTWPSTDRDRFDEVLEPLRAALGYAEQRAGQNAVDGTRALAPVVRSRHAVADVDLRASDGAALGLSGVHVVHGAGQPARLTPTGERHAHVLLGGGSWHRVSASQGWLASIASSFRVSVAAEAEDGTVQLFCLMFDDAGEQAARRFLGPLRSGVATEYGFRTRADAARFEIALYAPVHDLPRLITLHGFRLEREDVTRVPPGG